MEEGVADGRDTTASNPTKHRLRPATPKNKLENTYLKNYLAEHHVLGILKSLSVYELTIRYLFGIEGFCNAVTEALRCGVLATRVFMIMYRHGGEWTCRELAEKTGRCRQNVYKALTKLEKTGLAVRSSIHRWRLTNQLLSRPFPA